MSYNPTTGAWTPGPLATADLNDAMSKKLAKTGDASAATVALPAGAPSLATLLSGGSGSVFQSHAGAPPAFSGTSGNAWDYKFANSSTGAYQILGAGAFFFQDGVQFVYQMPAGSDVTQLNAVSTYVTNNAAASDFNNGINVTINYFGLSNATAPGSQVYAQNFVLGDTGPSSTSGRLCRGVEYDFNVGFTNTRLDGVVLRGGSVAQPTQAFGFTCDTLNAFMGTGAPMWTVGFQTTDGAAAIAFRVGLANNAVNQPSQPIAFGSTDINGNANEITIAAVGNNLVLSSLGGADNSAGLSLPIGGITLGRSGAYSHALAMLSADTGGAVQSVYFQSKGGNTVTLSTTAGSGYNASMMPLAAGGLAISASTSAPTTTTLPSGFGELVVVGTAATLYVNAGGTMRSVALS